MNKYRIISWILLFINIVVAIFAVQLIIVGSEPCASDGCLIHLLQFLGILLLIPSVIISLYIITKSLKNRLK